jgi:hypothetical protein
MDFQNLIFEMAENALRIRALAASVSDEQARWRPTKDTWSILEVIGHLLDEERLDFRVRLDYTLHRPGELWPPIDPRGWVQAHRYNEQDLGECLSAYLSARRASLIWLNGLADPDWQAIYEAPWGPITAGDLFAAWVAHDLLHTRQLVELSWAYSEFQLEPFSTRYAGTW